MYIHTATYIYTYMYMYIYSHTSVCVRVCVCLRMGLVPDKVSGDRVFCCAGSFVSQSVLPGEDFLDRLGGKDLKS